MLSTSLPLTQLFTTAAEPSQAYDCNVYLKKRLSNDSGQVILDDDFAKDGQYMRGFMENNSNYYGRSNVCDLQY